MLAIFFTIEHEQVLRTDLNNSEIRYTKKIMYFPDRGCVHTLLTLFVYTTAFGPSVRVCVALRYNGRIKTYMRDVNAVKTASRDTSRLSTHFNRAVESFWPHRVAAMRSALLVQAPPAPDDDRLTQLKSRSKYELLLSFRRLVAGAVCIWQECWNLLQTCQRNTANHQPNLVHVSVHAPIHLFIKN